MGTEAQGSLHKSLVIVTKYMMRSNCREEGLVRGHSPIEGKAWRQTAPFVTGGCKQKLLYLGKSVLVRVRRWSVISLKQTKGKCSVNYKKINKNKNK